jgi:hypothetical protein
VSPLLCPGEHQDHGERHPGDLLEHRAPGGPERSAGVTLTRPTATSSDTASCARSSVTGLFSRRDISVASRDKVVADAHASQAAAALGLSGIDVLRRHLEDGRRPIGQRLDDELRGPTPHDLELDGCHVLPPQANRVAVARLTRNDYGVLRPE